MSQKAHAKLGASTSQRWLNCPKSIALIEQAPPPVESEYAAEGTKAHGLCEKMLTVELNGNDGADIHELSELIEDAPSEMVESAEIFFNEVMRRKKEGTGAELLVEEKISLEFIDDDMFGTVDAAVVEHFGLLTVYDFKYGKGIIVDVEKNTQLIYYALGIAAKFDYNFTEVEMVICQPRAANPDGETEDERNGIKRWKISIDELQTWIPIFEKGVKRTKDKNARAFTGEWCRFCPAAVICPETSSKALQQAQIDFAPEADELPALPHPKDLQPEQISKILNAADAVERWIGEVQSYAYDLIKRGGTVKGWKLIEKRAQRQWKNAEKVELEGKKKFGNKIYSSPELLSPKQMESVAGKTWVNERIVSVSSGLRLAREEDEGEAMNQAKLDFDEIPNEKGGKNGKEKSGKKETGKKKK